LDVQQRIEPPIAQLAAQTHPFGAQMTLVDRNQLDVRDEPHELCLGPTDDPADPAVGPGVPQRADQRHDVAGVADRREPQDAQAPRHRRQPSRSIPPT
jgi:hypothetical protein